MRNFNLKEKATQFMSGRYGIDQMNKTLMILAFIMIILESILQTSIISIIALIIMFFAIYRTYSRNHSKRIAENKRFMKFFKPIRRVFSIQKMKIRERKNYRFRVCPNCKVVIRTSKIRGSRVLTCPRCKKEFKTHVFI